MVGTKTKTMQVTRDKTDFDRIADLGLLATTIVRRQTTKVENGILVLFHCP